MTNSDQSLERIEEKLADHDRQFIIIEDKLAEHDGRLARIEDKLTEHDGKLARIEDKLTNHDRQFLSIENKLDKMVTDNEKFNDRFGNYQQSTQWVVQLAFSLIASATLTVIITSVFRK